MTVLLGPYVEDHVVAKLFTQVSYSLGTTSSLGYNLGTDTSAIDSYRQGVEITSDKSLYAGTVKIWSGDPNHMPPQSVFGQTHITITDDPVFTELDNFNPVMYIEFFTTLDPISEEHVLHETFPIILSDADLEALRNYDGVIEPLTLRGKAAIYSIESPFWAHDIRGEFQAGNPNGINLGSDVVVNFVCRDDETNSANFFDSVDAFGQGGGNVLGTLSPDFVVVHPFDDTHTGTGILLTSNMQSDMRNALFNMTNVIMNGTGSYIRPGDDSYVDHNCITVGVGYTYDNALNGTDSLAFGGLSNSLNVAATTVIDT